jgi:hypothetical protein
MIFQARRERRCQPQDRRADRRVGARSPGFLPLLTVMRWSEAARGRARGRPSATQSARGRRRSKAATPCLIERAVCGRSGRGARASRSGATRTQAGQFTACLPGRGLLTLASGRREWTDGEAVAQVDARAQAWGAAWRGCLQQSPSRPGSGPPQRPAQPLRALARLGPRARDHAQWRPRRTWNCWTGLSGSGTTIRRPPGWEARRAFSSAL